jgi:hypothetical protein
MSTHGNFMHNSHLKGKNNCDCCTPNTGLTVDTYDSKKILNYIMSDSTQTYYGIIYYDIEKDMIFFKNKEGIEYSLFSKGRNISLNGSDNYMNNAHVNLSFIGDWKKSNKYSCNNIVKFDESFWICKNNIMNSNNTPNCDKNNWNMIIPKITTENNKINMDNKSNKNNSDTDSCEGISASSYDYNNSSGRSQSSSSCHSTQSNFIKSKHISSDSSDSSDSRSKTLKKIAPCSSEFNMNTDVILKNNLFNSTNSTQNRSNKKDYESKNGKSPQPQIEDDDNIKIWRCGKKYDSGSIVFFKNKLYQCKKLHDSADNNNPRTIDDPLKRKLWVSLKSDMDSNDTVINRRKPLFYGVAINNEEKYVLDSKTKTSIVNNSQQTDNFVTSEISSDLFDKMQYEMEMIDFPFSESSQKYKIKKYAKFKVPINFVGKNNVETYDYIECTQNLFIIKEGYYKITYNIVFEGAFDKLTSYVDMNINNEQKSNQVCASVKTINVDKDDMNYINHTFILPINNNNNNNRIDLVCDIMCRDKSSVQHIIIVPVKTWIFVECID